MSIHNELTELVTAGLINEDTAGKIRDHYKNKHKYPNERLTAIFGIAGALLIALGIILIIAQNWEILSQTTKTVLAFLPMLAGQIICGYVILRKRTSIAWREAGSSFLFLTVGGTLSLVSQIYNIPGNTEDFLLTWMLLCLPLIYLLNSTVSSLLFIIGITWYAVYLGYGPPLTSHIPYLYLPLLVAVVPFYAHLLRRKATNGVTPIHNWAIGLSLILALGTASNEYGNVLSVAYMSLFGGFSIIGKAELFSGQKPQSAAYTILGPLGTIITLLILSFEPFWLNLQKKYFLLSDFLISPEFIVAALTTLAAGGLLYRKIRSGGFKSVRLWETVFIWFILIYLIGMYSEIAVILVNLLILLIGIRTIGTGLRQNHLGILNYGLMIIAALAICRFFDERLSFVVRGLFFLVVGVLFFAANYRILKKK
jgi:uncharacterized membrane protein